MLFHTLPFAVFFVVVWSVYCALRHSPWRIHWLLLASYVFYSWWNPLYSILMAYSTLLDYYAVRFMARSRRRKFWLWVSIANNLFLLGFFKYAGFVTRNCNAALLWLGLPWSLSAPDVLLPVGISFYTFQSMSYTIDFYRGRLEGEPSLIRFAAFVSLFPQLVAGPIERAGNLLPQMREAPRINLRDLTDGASLFLVGLFKKLALSNYLGQYVDPVYADPGRYGAPALALATFAFGWQIYCDFSGYTDMARGVGRAFGFRFMLNFNNPYLATGIADFWARWHISLSTWFRDYVYIPLGGSRGGAWGTYRNLLITFLVSGLWHGAAWTFVVWGALHAGGTMLTRELERSSWYRERCPRICKQLGVFLFVTYTWIFFRAASLSDAVLITGRLFTGAWSDPAFPLLAMGLCLAVWAYAFLYESPWRSWLERPALRVALACAMILYLALVPGTPDRPFIYYQF